MMQCRQNVLGWKNINVNKVSETFDTGPQLCMMSLEEIEWLLVDIFINVKSNDVTIVCSERISLLTGGTLGIMYNDDIHSFSSKDNHRNYMLGYVNMASELRSYWIDVWCGDRIMMELIQNKLVGGHLLVENTSVLKTI